jgi:D-amino-acid oxidase
MSKRICILGAGVIGLTSAICFQNSGYSVKIIADRYDETICSRNAGAIWGPFLSKEDKKAYDWSLETLKVFRRLSENPLSGINIIDGVMAANFETHMPDWFKLLNQNHHYDEKLPVGYINAWRYSVPIIDMPKYLDWLKRKFLRSNGVLEKARINSFCEINDKFDSVVNCTGLGSIELCADKELYPMKGQLIIVSNPGINYFFAERGNAKELFYWMPHGNKIVIGGTAEKEYSHHLVDEIQINRMINNAKKIDDKFKKSVVISKKVGFRPCRNSIRFEFDKKYKNVFHNYGHGGSGVSLSWGCAQSVVNEIKAQ